MTAPRMRHVNRSATQERLVITRQRRASTGEQVVWTERAIPLVKPC